MTAGPGRGWTLAESVELEARAYGWLVLVTLPAVTLAVVQVLAIGAGDAGGLGWSVAWWVFGVPFVSALPALGAAIVVLPVTYGVGRCLRRVDSDAAHVGWTAVTAGLTAAVMIEVIAGATWYTAPFRADALLFGLVYAVPFGIAAAVAGALARIGQLRRAAAVVPVPAVESLPTPLG
ncbi:hypothetical protein [Curtobacterium citreum]|uniref:hypothetical protein n=1 Tax=Curtobacterium citreum TaxID=2036 RepID=UPI0025429104|nr:hypothetical protein [Curtobacterium citreum]WIJ44391.1 hypothetical protein QPK07_11695 [Curtobacterium citreum]